MIDQEKWFVILLVINTLAALVYLICCLALKKEKSKSCWFRAFVMLLCPVVGACFFLFGYLFFRLFFSRPVDLEDVIFSKERVQTFTRAEDSERNLVPLEEAIEITDTDELRSLMMNVVRGDIRQSLAAISLALNSRDTETAHYAASVLQDALNEFRMNAQKQYQKIREGDENQVAYAETLLDYMNQVLEQHVFTDMEQKNYVTMMDEVSDILFQKAQSSMSSAQYEAITLRLLEIEEYDKCEKWCQRAVVQQPNSLATYTCQLKLYFNSGQKARFFQVIDELKRSPVVIDSQTLELIRVFL